MSVLGLFFPCIQLLHWNLGKVPLPSARPEMPQWYFFWQPLPEVPLAVAMSSLLLWTPSLTIHGLSYPRGSLSLQEPNTPLQSSSISPWLCVLNSFQFPALYKAPGIHSLQSSSFTLGRATGSQGPLTHLETKWYLFKNAQFALTAILYYYFLCSSRFSFLSILNWLVDKTPFTFSSSSQRGIILMSTICLS